MYESELKEQNTIKERLDTTKRLKYYCNICKSHHFYDSEIGIKHLQNKNTKKISTIKSYHHNEKIDRQAKEIKKWVDDSGFEFEITYGKGNEFGDLRIDVNKGWKRGDHVDVSIWKEKGYHNSVKNYRDIPLSRAFNYIEEHLNGR